ncbi:MAG TPA: hypothetical protein VK550_31335 [Polyangiaceae bacterium]|nr:hypothetical protein [Polyangiaceae bacterium]
MIRAPGLMFVASLLASNCASSPPPGSIATDMEVMPHLRAGLGIDVLNEQPERWAGVIQHDGNVGRTDVLAGGVVSCTLGSVVASLAVKIPVYQHFIDVSHGQQGERGQLTYPAIVNLAVQTTFGGSSPLSLLSRPDPNASGPPDPRGPL